MGTSVTLFLCEDLYKFSFPWLKCVPARTLLDCAGLLTTMSADPEIKLPPEPDDLKNKSSNPDLKQDEREKRPDSDSWSGDRPTERLSANAEITWHYLTFETETPSPAYLATSASSDDSRAPPPECPNLKKYQSPFDWSPKRKAILTWISVTAAMFTAYTAGSYSAGIDQMTELWGISEVAAETGITIFTCGFAIAPMVLAPFSEIQGRRPMFVVTGILFVVFQVVCAVTPTFAGMLVARFLVGCAGSSFSTMVGGVVSDIYRAENRNTAMALFAGAALVGTGLGPLISGFIAHNTTWRWIFYLQVIVDGVVIVFIVFFFKETRGSVLLSRKAKALNKWYDSLEGHGYYGMMMPTQDPTKPVPPLPPPLHRACGILLLALDQLQLGDFISDVFSHPACLPNKLQLQPAGSRCRLHCHFRRRHDQHGHQHLPRETRPPLRKRQATRLPQQPRRPTILLLHPERAPPHRLLLVRLDAILLHPLDRTRSRRRLRNHGHLQHIPRRLQLPGRHLPQIRQLRPRRTKFLSKCPRRRFPAVHAPDVQRHDLPRRGEFPRRLRCASDRRAVDLGLLRPEDKSEE